MLRLLISGSDDKIEWMRAGVAIGLAAGLPSIGPLNDADLPHGGNLLETMFRYTRRGRQQLRQV